MARSALLFTSVLVLFCVQQVLSRTCNNMQDIENCNECLRCGGHWCNKELLDSPRCSREPDVGWCPDHREIIQYSNVTIQEVRLQDSSIPVYIETTARIDFANVVVVKYNSNKILKTKISQPQATQNILNIHVTHETRCTKGDCSIEVQMTPSKDFCSPMGTSVESVTFELSIDGMEYPVVIKYHVPCACKCAEGKNVERSSPFCTLRGDFSCGSCSCHSDRTGKYCETYKCPPHRGDINAGCISEFNEKVNCSGNGECVCDSCKCDMTKIGSQFYDEHCTDICTVSSYCEDCFLNFMTNNEEICQSCSRAIRFDPLNKTLLSSLDSFGQPNWINCSTSYDGCLVQYAAQMSFGDIHVMFISDCNGVADPSIVPGGASIAVPIVLGIIGVIIAATAVAGYMAWKNRSPPLPLTDPQYQNIGAEDCTGENPLYKPPTSVFHNPNYGKMVD